MTSISTQMELEVKLAAENISVADFISYCSSRGMSRYLDVEGYDYYLESGENVVRLRVQDGRPYEITVKKRKSSVSTTERIEVDIPLGNVDCTVEHVLRFFQLLGFTQSLHVFKRAHIFWLKKSGHEFTVVLYNVTSLNDKGILNNDEKRYLEIEIAKDAEVSIDQAKRLIREWKQEIQKALGIESEPINGSLYEIFTNKQYAIEKEDK